MITIKNPLVSVIIPTYNREKYLVKALQSLNLQNYPQNKIETIIIDNGSNDNTLQMLSLKFPKVLIIKNSRNIGFAPALNQGIKRSKGSFVLITNDDVIFDKDCLKELVRVANLDDKIAIVTGRMFFDKKPLEMALPAFRFNIWLGYHPYDFDNTDKIREMDVATGGCMLIRKSALMVIGLFDPGFFFCGEDYDICTRAKIAHFKVVYCPKAKIIHKFLNSSKKKNNFQQLFAHFRGKFRFMFIHASPLQLLFFLPIQIIIGPPFSYWQSRQKTLIPILAGLLYNVRNLKEISQAREKVNELRTKFQN